MRLRKAIKRGVRAVWRKVQFNDERSVLVIDGELRLFSRRYTYHQRCENIKGYTIIAHDDPILDTKGWF